MNKVKNEMAKMLAKWLFKDFGLLLEEPSEEEIKFSLEDYERKNENA